MMLGMMQEMKATLTLSILDSIRQRGLSTEAAADVAGLDADRMRALVEARDLKAFGVEELSDILEAIDASGPRMGDSATIMDMDDKELFNRLPLKLLEYDELGPFEFTKDDGGYLLHTDNRYDEVELPWPD